MQNFNRNSNATINANVAIQGAMVVGSANAHRAIPPYLPSDMRPVSKRPGTMPGSRMSTASERSQRYLSLTSPEQGYFATSPAGNSWRLDSQREQLPAILWATLVLNRTRD